MPYANYKENLLDQGKQQLMCCNQTIERLTKELKAAKKDKSEILRLLKAIEEVK